MLAVALLAALQSAAAPARTPPPPRPPTDWPFNLVTGEDYPARALRGDEQGVVAYRVEIGADGRVSNCSIRRSSGSDALDARTCEVVRRRARFTPARDSQGNAVPDAREGEMTWRLPSGD